MTALYNPTYMINQQRALFVLRGANFNSTADQALIQLGSFTRYQINDVMVLNPSISLTTAVGGFYTAASKGGTAFVAATQVYSSLTGPTVLLKCTNAGSVPSTLFTAFPLYFSLTTPQGAAATADIYIFGQDLS